jgi:hypothetical protein
VVTDFDDRYQGKRILLGLTGGIAAFVGRADPIAFRRAQKCGW